MLILLRFWMSSATSMLWPDVNPLRAMLARMLMGFDGMNGQQHHTLYMLDWSMVTAFWKTKIDYKPALFAEKVQGAKQLTRIPSKPLRSKLLITVNPSANDLSGHMATLTVTSALYRMLPKVPSNEVGKCFGNGHVNVYTCSPLSIVMDVELFACAAPTKYFFADK